MLRTSVHVRGAVGHVGMAVDDTLQNIFEQLAALKAYADASYRRGYHDGVARAVEILSLELEQSGTPPEHTAAPYQKRHSKARRGSVPSRILDALQEHDGATYQEIVETLERRGIAIPVQSIRSAMHRLLEGNMVKRHGRRWFLVRDIQNRTENEMQGGIASLARERNVAIEDDHAAIGAEADFIGVKG